MTPRNLERWLRLACVVSIVGIVLMMWALFDSSALAITMFMTAGQALGSLSLLIFVVVIVLDLKRRNVFARRGDSLKPKGPEEPT